MSEELKNIFFESKVLWSQVDANMHLRHSAYADFAAQARLEFLSSAGFGADFFAKLKVGPILFREELLYFREVPPNDVIRVTCLLTKSRTDGSRWSFRQELYRSDGIKAAQINVDGAWINTETRKLTGLPEEIVQLFMKMPKSDDFTEEQPQQKKA